MGWVFWMHKHCDPRDLRHGGLQQLEQLWAEVGGRESQASDVAAGPGHTRRIAVADRIRRYRGDHGNGRGGVLQRTGHMCSGRYDHIDLHARQLGGERSNTLKIPVSESCLDDEVLAFDIAELPHTLQERRVAAHVERRLARAEVEKPNVHDLRLRQGERVPPHREHARTEADEEVSTPDGNGAAPLVLTEGTGRREGGRPPTHGPHYRP